MKITVNFDCKTTYVAKDGSIPLTLRITINRKNDYLPLGKKIPVNYYDPEGRKIKSGVKGYTQITSFIKRQEVKVDEIITALEKQGDLITFSKIKELYNKDTNKVPSVSFYTFVEEEIKREREETNITSGTLDNYDNQLTKLKKYQPRLSIHQIDTEFIEKYIAYLKNTLKQSDNTQFHALTFLRKYTLKLYKAGKIKKYPFEDYKVGQPRMSEVEYLEPEEVTRLHDLYDSGQLLSYIKKASSKHARDFHVGNRYQSTLQHFLTACYCGFRHSDIKSLRREHLKDKFIVKPLKKGYMGKSKTIRIPTRKRLLSLLNLSQPTGLLFENPVQENGTTNNYLEEIMKLAGINKHITFHCARHTFAITSLILGIKLEVISDILGHSNISVTQRYARIVDRLRESEMDKWDKLAKEESEEDTSRSIDCPRCGVIALTYSDGIIISGSLSMKCRYCHHPFEVKL